MTDHAHKRDTQPDPAEHAATDTERAAAAPEVSEAEPDTGAEPAERAAEFEARAAEFRDKYLRLAAEFDNFRKRAARERDQAEHHGQSIVIRGLLESLDDLARFAALDAWNAEVETVIDGARMVEQKLMKTLAGHGLEVVNPAGHRFDPNVHEAVATTAAANADEDHVVAEVFQVGYVFNGKLLRPARVVVKQWSA